MASTDEQFVAGIRLLMNAWIDDMTFLRELGVDTLSHAALYMVAIVADIVGMSPQLAGDTLRDTMREVHRMNAQERELWEHMKARIVVLVAAEKRRG